MSVVSASDPIPPLRPDQQDIADHPARFKVVACGRRWGKTTLGLAMASEVAQAGGRVWWVAPTYGLAFHPWRTLRLAHRDIWEAKLESERHIDLPGGGSLTVKSADDPDTLRGVGLDFVVLDEAAFLSEETWAAVIRPALSDRLGRVLMISTPRGRNWFWQVYLRGQDPLNTEWRSWTYPTSTNPLIHPQEIEEARGLLPERVFRQEYMAEFVEDGGTVFRHVAQAATAAPQEHAQPGHRYIMGVDLARRVDFTVCAVIDISLDPPELVCLDRFNRIDWQFQIQRIATLAERFNVEQIMVDQTGLGDPVIEQLRQELNKAR